MFCRKIYLFLLGALLTLMIQAQPLSPSARIALLTCTPGEELYAHFGHTALRVYDPENEFDIIFNYGIFDFNTEHFYWKFVRGETWYELGVSPMWWFMREYEETQRPVYEQWLNLQPWERDTLWMLLETNYEPENRKYLYNFVFDNCATRPYELICRAIGDTIQSTYQGYSGRTFRSIIRHYNGTHSWANAGINLLFGPKADRPMTDRERLFMPEELMLWLAQAYEIDGTHVAYMPADVAPFVTPKTPWYASWEFGLAVYFLLVFLISLHDRSRGHQSWWLDGTVGVLYGLLLLLVAFLTFFSCHPLVGFGWRLLIIPLTHLCARSISFFHW